MPHINEGARAVQRLLDWRVDNPRSGNGSDQAPLRADRKASPNCRHGSPDAPRRTLLPL